nr:hypothetical protein CFP56_74051 [Quercus suber]
MDISIRIINIEKNPSQRRPSTTDKLISYRRRHQSVHQLRTLPRDMNDDPTLSQHNHKLVYRIQNTCLGKIYNLENSWVFQNLDLYKEKFKQLRGQDFITPHYESVVVNEDED